MVKPFADALRDRDQIFFDGATGTQLAARGAPPGPMANVQAPESVLAVHRSYLAAGSVAILTNTLTANRLALGHGADTELIRIINQEGVRLCKQAAEGKAYVVGDVGSTGQFLEPYGDYTEDQFYEVFLEQVQILSEGNVDAIAIETMTDLRETLILLRACKDTTGVPVMALMSFDSGAAGYRTMMGVTPEEAAKALTEAGADAIGTNCGTVGPGEMAEIIKAMASVSDLPLMAEPNAGKPQLIDGRMAYSDISIEEYAAGCEQIARAGATIIGGCCGTDPSYIEAVIRRLG